MKPKIVTLILEQAGKLQATVGLLLVQPQVGSLA